MNALPLIIGGGLLLALTRRKPVTVVVPVAPEPAPPAPADGGATVTPGDVYYVVQPGDTAVELARHWTGDPDRWRELRDAQPARTRRNAISSGIMQAGWRLRVPDNWFAPDDVPNSALQMYADAVIDDPDVARTT
jgi:hypothetical protein